MGVLLLSDTCLARYEDIPAAEKCERTVNAGLGGLFDFSSCSAMLDWRLRFSFSSLFFSLLLLLLEMFDLDTRYSIVICS